MMKDDVDELQSGVIFVFNRLRHLRDGEWETVGGRRRFEESCNLIFTPTISLSCQLY